MYVAVHRTGKYYSSCTLPIYPLSIYARDNPPSAQPRLGVRIEERPLRGPPPHIDPRTGIVLGYSCVIHCITAAAISAVTTVLGVHVCFFIRIMGRTHTGDPILSWAVPTYPRVQKPIDRARGRGYAL